MPYLISRNGQTYGPYTLEDLQRYIASGHVLSTDLAQSEEGADWIPVSQLTGVHATPPTGYPAPPSGAGAPPVFGAAQPYTSIPGAMPPGVPFGSPPPPDLNWGLVLLFDILTCSLFQMVWNIILGAWFRRVYPSSKVLWLYIASAFLLVVQGGLGQAVGFMAGGGHGFHYHRHGGSSVLSYSLIALVCWVVRLVARFTFRAELEQHYNTVEPIGLRVDPVMTFFFGGIYLQSVMNRINQSRRFGAYGVPR